MIVYDIPTDVAERDYHGCGKAWAAIRDGKVVAIRYMSPGRGYPHEDLMHMTDLRYGLMDHEREIYPAHAFWFDQKAQNPNRGMPYISTAAKLSGRWPSKAEYYRAMAREQEANQRAGRAAFEAYRAACREDLAKMGDVISGMCSCHQFCAR